MSLLKCHREVHGYQVSGVPENWKCASLLLVTGQYADVVGEKGFLDHGVKHNTEGWYSNEMKGAWTQVTSQSKAQ